MLISFAKASLICFSIGDRFFSKSSIARRENDTIPAHPGLSHASQVGRYRLLSERLKAGKLIPLSLRIRGLRLPSAPRSAVLHRSKFPRIFSNGATSMPACSNCLNGIGFRVQDLGSSLHWGLFGGSLLYGGRAALGI